MDDPPQLISDNEFTPDIKNLSLEDKEDNHTAYEKIIQSSKAKPLERHSSDQWLYAYGDKIVMLNMKRQRVDYYTKVVRGSYHLTGKFATQEELWRNSFSSTTDITNKVIYDYVLKATGTVLSDSLQTDNGRRYWIRVVKEAFDRGINVYILDNNAGELSSIHDIDEYETSVEHAYGTEKKHGNIRIVISAKNLL